MDVVPIEVVPLKPPAARAGRPAVSDRGIAGAVLAVLQVPRQPAQKLRIALGFDHESDAIFWIILREHAAHHLIKAQVDALARHDQGHGRQMVGDDGMTQAAAKIAAIFVGAQPQQQGKDNRPGGHHAVADEQETHPSISEIRVRPLMSSAAFCPLL